MDLVFLESFVTVAECGSFAEAARRLNLTPAALAQRVRRIEADLGHQLITRVGRTVRPTESGLAVLRRAPLLLEAARELRALAAGDEPAGLMRLGATATALVGIVPGIIADLRRRHPRIAYHLRPAASVDLYHAVLEGQLDAAIIVRPHFALPKSVDWLTLRDEPLVLIAPAGTDMRDPHRLISEAPFIRYDRNQWGGQIVERYLQEQRLEVAEWLELDALDAIAAMVSQGQGVAIVPDWAPPWPEGLRLEKLRLPGGLARQTGLIWQISGRHPAAMAAFARAATEFAATRAT